MATPQFSLRRLLLLVTIAGILCIVPAVAAQGLLWSIAPAMMLAGAVVLALVGAVMFAVIGGVAASVVRGREPAGKREPGN